jgi:glutathione S-transferase
MYKLYDNDFAPSPRRVRMFMAEKGLPCERIAVDIAAGETRSADFLGVNARGEVPVLELPDGTRLCESLAICRYLEECHPEPNLLGKDALERADIDAWVLRLMFGIYQPSTLAFRHGHKFWAGKIEQIPAYGALAKQQVLNEWQTMDAHLQHHRYIVGDTFSFADIVAFTTLEFGKPSGIRIGTEQANLRRWHTEIASRPSAAA